MPKREKPHYHFDSAVSLNYLGWLMGLEPTTTGITIQVKNLAFMRVSAGFVGIFGTFSTTYLMGLRGVVPTKTAQNDLIDWSQNKGLAEPKFGVRFGTTNTLKK